MCIVVNLGREIPPCAFIMRVFTVVYVGTGKRPTQM